MPRIVPLYSMQTTEQSAAARFWVEGEIAPRVDGQTIVIQRRELPARAQKPASTRNTPLQEQRCANPEDGDDDGVGMGGTIEHAKLIDANIHLY